MDSIGWFIATTHQLLGHDQAAALAGVDPGDKADCVICKYERSHDEADRLAVLAALVPTPEWAARPTVVGPRHGA
jgi:hypothetical protein